MGSRSSFPGEEQKDAKNETLNIFCSLFLSLPHMWILQTRSISGLEQVYRGENRGHRAYSGEKSKKLSKFA